MSDYTHINLADVEDMAPKFGLAPGLQSRFAREALDCEKSGMSYYRIAPNFRVPFGHHHTHQEEIYVLLAGSARMKIEDEIIDLKPLDAVRVPPQLTRATEAGPEGAEVLAFGAPQESQADAELVQGWWSD